MGEAATPVPEGTAPAAPPRPRVRVTGIAGALAALALGLSFFLPWVHVGPERARQFHDAVVRDLEARERLPAGGEGFRRLAETMVAERVLKGTDFIRWIRTAKTFSAELDAQYNRGVGAAAHQRRLEIVRLLLYGLPAAAFLLAAHFVFHRFRRARWPVLVLCILVGVAAVVLAGTLQFAHGFIRQALEEAHPGGDLAVGWLLLLWGGVVLGLAGFFGVTAKNWFRVYAVSAATAAALGFLAVRYLDTGGIP